jgi:hypothetical protein
MIESLKKELKLNIIAEGNNEMFEWVLGLCYVWKQMISINIIQFEILLQPTWRSHMNYPGHTRIPGGRICELWTARWTQGDRHFPWRNPSNYYHWTKDGKSTHTFNSTSNSKFCIRMKNECPSLHEIAVRFLLCFPPHIFVELHFLLWLCLRETEEPTATFWLSPFGYHFNSC